LTPLTRTITR